MLLLAVRLVIWLVILILSTLFGSDEGVHFDDDSQQQQEPSNQTGPTFNIKWPTRLADPPGSGQQVVHVTDQTERVGEQPVHGLRSDSDIMNMSKTVHCSFISASEA